MPDIQREAPEVAASLDNLRYLVFHGEKGDKGDTGPAGATGATGPQGPQGVAGDSIVVRLTMDQDGYVYDGDTPITGAEINALAATSGKVVVLWDEDNARQWWYFSEGGSGSAVFVQQPETANLVLIQTVAANTNEATFSQSLVLPLVTDSDNGKVLGVVSGAWATTAKPAVVIYIADDCTMVYNGGSIETDEVAAMAQSGVVVTAMYEPVQNTGQYIHLNLSESDEQGTITFTGICNHNNAWSICIATESQGDILNISYQAL